MALARLAHSTACLENRHETCKGTAPGGQTMPLPCTCWCHTSRFAGHFREPIRDDRSPVDGDKEQGPSGE